MDKEWKARAHALKPQIWIGKEGINKEVCLHIVNVLKKKKIVKIKLLKAFIEKNNRKEIAKELADRTDSDVVDLTGFVLVLRKK
jgi:RNA-binding protein